MMVEHVGTLVRQNFGRMSFVVLPAHHDVVEPTERCDVVVHHYQVAVPTIIHPSAIPQHQTQANQRHHEADGKEDYTYYI